MAMHLPLIGRRGFLIGIGGLLAGSLVPAFLRAAASGRRHGLAANKILLVTVAAASGRFLAWPANNGLWHWDDGRELLVGYIDGPWIDKADHKVGEPSRHHLSRSLDGGDTWHPEAPHPYVDHQPKPVPVTEPIHFDHPDLALRVEQGSFTIPEDRSGRFLVSFDRGHSWQRPFRFTGLEGEPSLKDMVMTSRTSYLLRSRDSALFLMSAQDLRPGDPSKRLDKPFVAETLDGGRSFRFLSWVVPLSDPYRAVMPSLVTLGPGHLVVALRRRDFQGSEEANWVDAYATVDGGHSWSFLSRVGETGTWNGNPPALVAMRDGRLACVYGNRTRRTILVRISHDGGRSWGAERVLRYNPHSKDLGYPQLAQNHRGELVALYYLATSERPQSYIEAAIFRG